MSQIFGQLIGQQQECSQSIFQALLDQETQFQDQDIEHDLLLQASQEGQKNDLQLQFGSQKSEPLSPISSIKADSLKGSLLSGLTHTTQQKRQDSSSICPSSDRIRFLKGQAKRIQQQIIKQQRLLKNSKKDIKDLDIDINNNTQRQITSRHRRRRLTKKALQVLSKKFDQFYSLKAPKTNLKDIGKMFDIGFTTTQKLYSQWMQDPSFFNRTNKQSLKKGVPQRKVTLERLEHVARLIKENPFMTQNELTVQLNKIQGLKVSKNGEKVQITRTTVARLLKTGKFKKKRVKCVPKQRNTTKSLQKRHQYCRKYQDIWMKNSKVYFLDQSGFNLYMTRDKAWARPNQQITVNCPISKGKRFSLIAIIAEDGLTQWRIIQGTYRKYQYLDFVKQLFVRLREDMDQLTQQQRNSQQNMRQKWLILDNCAIHDRQVTIQLGRQCGMNVLYLPPYSPQLSPIQNWFHQVKAKIRKINYSGQKQLLQIMQRTLKDYQDYDFGNYFRSVLKHVQKGINKQKF